MSNIVEYKNIVLKYIKENSLHSLQVISNRIIVTINQLEDSVLKQKIREEIEQYDASKKVSVVFIKEKEDEKNAQDKWQIKGVKHIVAVSSAKGGVGKSTTSVNLALALANQGVKVALFDADIYGPSIPKMLGYENVPPTSCDGRFFEPYMECGIKSMSIGSMIKDDAALIWRGAKACGAIEQLLTQTNWGDVDVMVIDMPPGTGDIQITMSQKISFSGAVIVSTPQDIALIDAVKGINLFNKIGVSILGVIENMSYYVCEKCGARVDIFGHGGAEETAKKYNVDFLGAIPLHYNIRINSDSGTPIVLSIPDSPQAMSYEDIACRIIEKLK